ncbi:protein of unknown function [Burkholderia multivorans]
MCFWYSCAPLSIATKNALSSDFITSATLGLCGPCSCACTAAHGTAAAMTATSEAVRNRRREAGFIGNISWRRGPEGHLVLIDVRQTFAPCRPDNGLQCGRYDGREMLETADCRSRAVHACAAAGPRRRKDGYAGPFRAGAQAI